MKGFLLSGRLYTKAKKGFLQHFAGKVYRLSVTLGMANTSGHGNSSLWGKLCDINTLRLAWAKVRRNGGRAGTDGLTVRRFDRSIERNLSLVQSDLPRYRPMPYLRRYIRNANGKVRALDVPCVRDRLVLRALLDVLAPVADQYIPCNVFGFRRGTGAQAAVQRAEQLVREGKVWAFRSDIQDFFGHIDHSRLLQRLPKITCDERILSLIDKFLNAGIRENGKVAFPKKGIAQGSCLSPLLSNIYLMSFDVSMLSAGCDMLRYADDILVLAATRTQAQRAASLARELLSELGLVLNNAKTSITHVRDGIQFLGFLIDSVSMQPSPSARKRLERGIEYIVNSHQITLYEKARKLKQLIRGWLNYYGISANTLPWNSPGPLILTERTLAVQIKAKLHLPAAESGEQLLVYLDARKRLAAVAEEVRQIERSIYEGWSTSAEILPQRFRILCHD